MESFQRLSTVDALAQALRQSVFDGSLAPGTYLREVQLAASYGVAVHTVRASLQVLVLEGVLRHTPHRGTHVPELTADDVVGIFRLRAALESEAIRLIITGARPPTATSDAMARFDLLPDDATWDVVVEADLAFHRGVMTDAGCERLSRAYAGAQSEIQLCMAQLRPTYERPSQEAAEHRELLETLLARDLAAADRAFRTHWDDATENLLPTLPTDQPPVR
jgi:DNA-binding GntR family transcriptional regulator